MMSMCLQKAVEDDNLSSLTPREMIAAANSIPEGRPVGTIARRPDGWWIAHRTGAGWEYTELVTGTWRGSDADSWPVIYDPTGKTLDELQAEIDRLDKAEDSALRERDHWEETVDRILYTCSSVDEIGEWSSANDPVERFIEQFRPVKRINPTAQQEPVDPREGPSCGHPDHGNIGHFCQPFTRDFLNSPKPPRTPRVVDRLGVGEQGSRWRGAHGWVYEYRQGDQWYADGSPCGRRFEPHNHSPYTEIVEPRVLPSLHCEEARDGTVWADADQGNTWYYRFNAKWEYRPESGGKWSVVRVSELISENGWYTEVLPDVE